MVDVVEQVAAAIAREKLLEPGASVVVGVSGGADSLTLLHVLVRLRERLGLTVAAATLDHGLRGEAGASDAAFVRATAEAWGLRVIVGRADVRALARAQRLNIEEAARQARYTFLLRAARQLGAETVAVGHNRDDQVETVLMHLLRGSGLSGLRGMLLRLRLNTYHLLPDAPIAFDPPEDPAAPPLWPWLVRPLLDVSRAAIDAYAAEHALNPRYDATNEDTTLFRNRLRHELIPLLETINPNIRTVLARTAAVLRADAELVHAVGQAALERVARAMGPQGVVLDRAGWSALSLAEKRYILRAATWSLRPELRDVTFEQVEAALRIADEGTTGSAATLPGGLLLRVGYGTLTIAPEGVPDVSERPGEDAPALEPGTADVPFLPGEHFRRVAGGWRIDVWPLADPGEGAALMDDPLAAVLAVPPGAWLSLRTRRRGERFRPHGMGGRSQKLSDTLINMKVPAAWRDRVPVLAIDGEAAWFVAPTAEGVRGRVAEPFASAAGEGYRWIAARWRRAGPDL